MLFISCAQIYEKGAFFFPVLFLKGQLCLFNITLTAV